MGKKKHLVLSSMMLTFMVFSSQSNAGTVKAVVVYTDNAEQALGSTAMDDDAADHDLGFDLKTSEDSQTAFFEIEVLSTHEADSTYSEGNDLHEDVLNKAKNGTIKVDGSTLPDLRRQTGADMVIVVTTADKCCSGLKSANGVASISPVNETNYILTSKVNNSEPDGWVWLHEVLHLLGVDKDADHGCFQSGVSSSLCNAEKNAITNSGNAMINYGETNAQNNPPHAADIGATCIINSKWEVTVYQDPGIFDAIIERRQGSGPWEETWSAGSAGCILRSGSYSYRSVFEDVFGNRGAYSFVVTTSGSCGGPPN